jgi:hypothetical protein
MNLSWMPRLDTPEHPAWHRRGAFGSKEPGARRVQGIAKGAGRARGLCLRPRASCFGILWRISFRGAGSHPRITSGAGFRRTVGFGRGGRDRTRADAVLETAALPLSYSPVGREIYAPVGAKTGPWGRVRTADLLIHIQAFLPAELPQGDRPRPRPRSLCELRGQSSRTKAGLPVEAPKARRLVPAG